MSSGECYQLCAARHFALAGSEPGWSFSLRRPGLARVVISPQSAFVFKIDDRVIFTGVFLNTRPQPLLPFPDQGQVLLVGLGFRLLERISHLRQNPLNRHWVVQNAGHPFHNGSQPGTIPEIHRQSKVGRGSRHNCQYPLSAEPGKSTGSTPQSQSCQPYKRYIFSHP